MKKEDQKAEASFESRHLSAAHQGHPKHRLQRPAQATKESLLIASGHIQSQGALASSNLNRYIHI